MMPKWHVLYGFVFTYILLYFFGFPILSGIIIFLSAIFIDIDHYIRFVVKTKKIHPRSFWDWSMQMKERQGVFSKEEKESCKKSIFFLHGIEAFIIFFFLGYLSVFFWWVLGGFGFHLFLDFIEIIYKKEGFLSKTSQFWVWQTNKKLITASKIQ